MTTSHPSFAVNVTLWRAMLAAMVAVCGCTCRGPVKPDEPPAKPETTLVPQGVFTDDTDTVRGLSDLARDADGQLWAIPERQDFLLRATFGVGTVQWVPYTVQGKPADTDGEALTWLAPGKFAIGTERHVDQRATDLLLIGHLHDQTAIIDQQVALPYSLWGMLAADNKGIEGVCAAAGAILAGVETVIDAGGRRYAPLGRYTIASGTWSALRLQLTSTTGKISALSCAAQPDGAVQLWAIERHYGIARWLRATIAAGATGDIVARVHADLAVPTHAALTTVPNFEGMAADGSDPTAVWLIADNDSGGLKSGPNLIVKLGAAVPHR